MISIVVRLSFVQANESWSWRCWRAFFLESSKSSSILGSRRYHLVSWSLLNQTYFKFKLNKSLLLSSIFAHNLLKARHEWLVYKPRNSDLSHFSPQHLELDPIPHRLTLSTSIQSSRNIPISFRFAVYSLFALLNTSGYLE